VDQGHEVYCVVHEVNPNESIASNALLQPPLQYLANPFRSFLAAHKLARVIVKHKPDIIHILVEPYATLIPFLHIPSRTKVYITVHGTYSFIPALYQGGVRRLISKIVTRLVYQRVHMIIAVSHFTKNYLLQQYAAQYHSNTIKEKIHVITNGIAAPKRQNPPIPKAQDQRKRLLYVGALKPRKGLLQLLDALKAYYDRYHSYVELDIVGSMSDEKYLALVQQKAADYGLKEHVLFHGILSDAELEQQYQNAHCFVLASLSGTSFEGFGIVYLEASLRGLPSIGSRDSGAADAIKDGVTGYLVDPHDPDAFSTALHRVLDEEAIEPAACIAWAAQHSIEEMTSKIAALYATDLKGE
jgi:glycosyltransferase involved in cell wall biosynthesis